MSEHALLRPLRRHEVLHRSLYVVDHDGPGGEAARYTVEVDQSDVDGKAVLYRDGVRQARCEMPAAFPVPGGFIEVDASLYGMRRVHLVLDCGTQHRLRPAHGTLQDLRARLARRHPRLSRAIGGLAVAVLVVNLVLAVPVALEWITAIPRVAEIVGTFTSPISLPGTVNTVLIVAGVVAAVERALTWRRHRLLDLETIWTAV